MGRETDAWPVWDGSRRLDGRRVRLNYPGGTAYAVGVAQRGWTRDYYLLEGTDIWFGTHPERVQVAPEGTR